VNGNGLALAQRPAGPEKLGRQNSQPRRDDDQRRPRQHNHGDPDEHDGSTSDCDYELLHNGFVLSADPLGRAGVSNTLSTRPPSMSMTSACQLPQASVAPSLS